MTHEEAYIGVRDMLIRHVICIICTFVAACPYAQNVCTMGGPDLQILVAFE